MVCTRFTLVNTLVLTVELHGKRMVMYYYFYHGIIHFALQLLHGKPPPVICSGILFTSSKFSWNLEANDVDLCAHTIPVRLMSHAGGLVCNGIYIHMLSIAAAYYRGD